MIAPSDPVGSGLVESLAHPGLNITGLTWMSRDIMGKRLQLLKEALPRTSRLGDLWNPTNPATRGDFGEMEIAARTLGIGIHSVEVRDPSELAGAFATIAKARVDGLLVQADLLTWVHRKRIAELALNNHVPTMFPFREGAEDGGLMAFGGSIADLYRRSAAYIDKMLKGTRPGDLPIEQPTRFELIINMKTAKALGITIPEVILVRADEVLR